MQIIRVYDLSSGLKDYLCATPGRCVMEKNMISPTSCKVLLEKIMLNCKLLKMLCCRYYFEWHSWLCSICIFYAFLNLREKWYWLKHFPFLCCRRTSKSRQPINLIIDILRSSNSSIKWHITWNIPVVHRSLIAVLFWPCNRKSVWQALLWSGKELL